MSEENKIVFLVGLSEDIDTLKDKLSKEYKWMDDDPNTDMIACIDDDKYVVKHPLQKKKDGWNTANQKWSNLNRDQKQIDIYLLYKKETQGFYLDFPIPLNWAKHLKVIDLDSIPNEIKDMELIDLDKASDKIKDMELIDIPYFNAECLLIAKDSGCCELNLSEKPSADFQEKFSSINKLLNYYQNSKIRKNPRILYDNDAVYFYHYDEKISLQKDKNRREEYALRGDIMMSFWMPVASCFLKKTTALPKNEDEISNLRTVFSNNNNDDKIKEEIEKEIKKEIKKFASNYTTRGNMLLLPNTYNGIPNKDCELGKKRMNTDRGGRNSIQDKIDQTLWHCFTGEKGEEHNLSCYFNNDNNLKEWIKAEHLECMFVKDFFTKPDVEIKYPFDIPDAQITQENIQPLVKGKSVEKYKFSDLTTDKEWLTFFKNINKVIAYRNKIMELGKFESYLPFALPISLGNDFRSPNPNDT